MNRNKKIRIRKLFESVSLILFLLVFVIAAPLPLAAEETYDSSDLPTMDVWLDNEESTYINFFGAVIGDHYIVSLYASDGTTRLAGPCPWELTTESEGWPFDDFGIPIMAGNIVSLVYAPDGVPTTFENRYQVADFGVSEANVNTEIITGYTNGTLPVDVIIFYGSEEDPYQNSRQAEIVGGKWTADFSTPGNGYGAYDIDTQTRGIISQPDISGNNTFHSWWAPNPCFDVHTDTNTVFGWDWSGEVTVDLTPNDTTTGQYTIPILEDGNGSFEDISLGGADLYAGQEIKVWDYMITKDITVGNLRIDYIDAENDKVYLTSSPNVYIQLVIVINNPPTSDEDMVGYWESQTDADGSFIADFSGGDPEHVFDITSTTSGFAREYDGSGNATMFGWSVADYYSGTSGDIDGSGVIDKKDATILTQYIAGKITLTINQKASADYNHDGAVNALDLKAIQKIIHTKTR